MHFGVLAFFGFLVWIPKTVLKVADVERVRIQRFGQELAGCPLLVARPSLVLCLGA